MVPLRPDTLLCSTLTGVNDLRTAFSLSASERLDLRDFAYRGVGEIGDTVWRDDNRNGIQDPAEPGIAGVGVELVWAGFDGVLDTEDDYRYPKQFTDADGLYLFGELPPGSVRSCDRSGIRAHGDNADRVFDQSCRR